jgi:CRISPR-associated protein Csm4
MKLYKIGITPTSNFATSLKGDTLFGHLCWAIRYKFGEKRLSSLLSDYANGSEPFLVVSDAFAKGYLPKPKMPITLLKEKREDKKLNRKKIWVPYSELFKGNYSSAKSDKEIDNYDKLSMQIHNAINYKTFHTGDGFDPYGLQSWNYSSKEFYCLVDENKLSKDELQKILDILSEMGYGKKTTIGKGRFKIDSIEDVAINNVSTVYMALGPFSARGINCKNIYYEPFTRFGKFGADRAFKNVFKKPILLADTACVIEFEEEKNIQYIGKHITNISDTHEDTVHQGYSIVVPLKGLEYDRE